MELVLHARNVELYPRLRAIAERKVGTLGRLAPDTQRVEIDFADQRNPRVAEHSRCALRLLGRRGTLTAHAVAPDPLLALDRAVAKLRHQVERRKGRQTIRTRAVS
jgi:ribosomal subunit interface protein